MFIKKKGPALPKAPDLSKDSSFGLFKRKLNIDEEPSAANKSTLSFNVIDVEDVREVPSEPRSNAVEVEQGVPNQAAADDTAQHSGQTSHPSGEHVAGGSGVRVKFRAKNEATSAPAVTAEPVPATEQAADKPKTKGLFARKDAKPEPKTDPAERESESVPLKGLFASLKKPVAQAEHATLEAETTLPLSQASAEQPRTTPASGAKKLFGSKLFGKTVLGKRESTDEAGTTEDPVVQILSEPASSTPESKSAATGWLNSLKRTSSGSPKQTAAEKSDKSSKLEEKAEAKKKGAAKPTSKGKFIDVLVELEGERRVYWRVTAAGLEELDPQHVKEAASFSTSEQRFSTEAALSYNAAQDLALSEMGEDVRIVNASKGLNAVYASTAARINTVLPVSTGPGLRLLELLMGAERAEGEELICGLILSGDSSSSSVAVLYHFNSNNEASPVQVTVNPDNLSFVLSQFASSRRLDTQSTKVLLYRNDDLLKVASKLELYPGEAMWNGVSLRKSLWMLTLAGMGAASLMGVYAGQAYVADQMASAKLSTAKKDKAQLDTQVDELLKGSILSFAKTQSLHLESVTETAGTLWSPGTKVAVEATPGVQRYTVLLPLTRGNLNGGRPSVLDPVMPQDVQPLLDGEVPSGCMKSIPEISGAMNAVQINVTCESPSGPLSGYRID